jgi:chitinase
MRTVVWSRFGAPCLLIALATALAAAGSVGEDVKAESFAVAAYLPDYRLGSAFAANLNASALHLTDLILFSVAPRPNLSERLMLSMCCLSSDHYEMARQARAHKDLQLGHLDNKSDSSSLKLWVTVGGGGRSDQFPLHDSAKGAKLTAALVDLARRELLDGVDLDCEHFTTQQDYLNYMLWVNATAHRLREHGVKVSVALHAGQLAFPDVYDAVDRVHLTTYDMVGAYHADLASTEDAATKLVQSGCPSHKVLLGIPAYSRHQGDSSKVRTFAETFDAAEVSGLNGFDLDALGSNYEGYMGDSPKSVREKVKLAKSLHLGGLFFWELGQDKHDSSVGAPGGVLLEAAATGKVFGALESEESAQDREL